MPLLPIIIAMLGYSLIRRLTQRLRKYRRPSQGSLILSDIASPYMAEIARGQHEDIYFSVLASFGDLSGRQEYRVIPQKLIGSAVYRVDLPFVTKAHLLGVPKGIGGTQPMIGMNIESVVLEGDFPNYFSLYAEKGQQVQTRYLLDPTAMQYIVDFCGEFYWEIIGDQLIFLQPIIPSPETAADVLGAVKGFVDHIRPAVEEEVSQERHLQRASYGEERRTLLCPLCASVMSKHDRYLMCPLGHGILAYGGVLSDLRSGKIEITPAQITPLKHDDLQCPSCRHEMVRVQYDATKVIIDCCSNCPYRWLDGDEIQPIQAGKRLDAVDIGRPIVMHIPEPMRHY